MKKKRILTVASGGGHWEQMLLLADAFANHEVIYATTLRGLPERAGIAKASIIPDCNRHQIMEIVKCVIYLFFLLCRHRPHVVLSTGALPGVIALALGKIFQCRTIWIDSVANAEELSMSGGLAKRFADLWMTQWEHLARRTGAEYAGSVL